MINLSVNINKIATLRNARGGNIPNIVQVAKDCETFGADGITVHPRPDERHIKYSDVLELSSIVSTEFNIEGYPSKEFIDLVLKVSPKQVTLVPDPPNAITSSFGWDTIKYKDYLKEIILIFNKAKIRTSIFVNPDVKMIENAKDTDTNRIELYTEGYARSNNKNKAIEPYILSAIKAKELKIGINAGHDLNLNNLNFFKTKMPYLDEVSIGHALICDAIYLGLENTIKLYKKALK